MSKRSGCRLKEGEGRKDTFILDVVGRRIVVTRTMKQRVTFLQTDYIIETYASRQDCRGEDHWFQEGWDCTDIGTTSAALCETIFEAARKYGTRVENWRE